jgi:hypothetical protein
MMTIDSAIQMLFSLLDAQDDCKSTLDLTPLLQNQIQRGVMEYADLTRPFHLGILQRLVM